MDLTWSDEEEAFRAEARAWLERNLAEWHDEVGGHAGVGRHPRGLRPAPRSGSGALFADRWAVVSWAPEHGGRGASLWEWLLFEEEYYRAGGPQRVTQNGIFLLAPSIYEFGTPEQRDGILPAHGRRPRTCGARGGPSRTPAATWPRCRAGPARVDGGWVLDGQKTWTTRGAFCTHLFGLFRTDPESERHKGLTYLLVPLDTPGVTVRGFGRLDGDEGFAEVFFDDAFLADDAVPGGVVLGELEGGWGVAMATAGSERGLTLRSPGRFLATAGRLVDEYRRAGADDPLLRRRIADAWMKAEAYQLQTLQTVTRLAAGEKAGAEASLTKLWWSRARRRAARGRPRPARPRGRARGPVEQGLAVLAVGPDLRRHQRDPAQHRRRAPPRAAATPMRFAWTDDQLAFRDAVRDLLAKECPPAVVRAAWDAPAGALDRGVWDSLDGMGVLSVLVPEADGGLGLDECFLVPVLEETGRVAPAAPDRRDGDGGGAARRRPAGMVTTTLGGPRAVRRSTPTPLLVDDGGRLRAASTTVDVAPVDTVDRGRRTGDLVARPPTARSSPTTRPPSPLAFDRGVLGTAAQLVGLQPGDARPHRRLRDRAPAVRRARSAASRR